MRISVIGAGLGREELLSQAALDKIKKADLVVSTDRLYEKFKKLNKNSISLEISEMAGKVKSQEGLQSIVILASGDVGFYSVSKTLKNSLSGYDIEFINGTSSLQYLAAKMQISYERVKTVSVHGRDKSVIPYVCYNQQVFVLTGGKYKAHNVIDEIVSFGLGEVLVTVGENLGDVNERIITDKARALKGIQFGNLCVLLVENNRHSNQNKIFCDSDFIRAKVPMTKREVRELSLAKLEIMPTDIVYDIGAGTGSISIASAYRANEGFVYAVEKETAAIDIIRKNKEKLSAYNLCEIHEKAPQGLECLPRPTKVFIGGSSGNLNEIFEAVLFKNSKARIVVNAITIETLKEAVTCFEARKITPDIICVNISKAEKIGNYNMMQAENPVYIISGENEE